MKVFEVLLLLAFVQNCLTLTQLEAQGLEESGLCNSITISTDCSWTSACPGNKVLCSNGILSWVTYKPNAGDGATFRSVINKFDQYFENVSTIRINDTLLSPPVPWTLSNSLKNIKKTFAVNIWSQPGGLHGPLPPFFGSNVLSTLIIDGEIEGTIPSIFFDLSNLCSIDIKNHRLVGTIPQALITNTLCKFHLQSANGNLVGTIPNAQDCLVTENYHTGLGYNGGFFCSCGGSCTRDDTAGVNPCYYYTDPTQIVDGCMSIPSIPGCTDARLSMRYGPLCYDECSAGCPMGFACGITEVNSMPTYACLEITYSHASTETTNTDASFSSNQAVSFIEISRLCKLIAFSHILKLL
jgi:hypothetical protein